MSPSTTVRQINYRQPDSRSSDLRMLGETERVRDRARIAHAAHDLGNRLQEVGNSFGLIRRKIREGDIAAIQALIEIGEASLIGAGALAHRLLSDYRPPERRSNPIEVSALLRVMLPALRVVAGEGITVSARSAHADHMLECDFDGLQDALTNLILNAKDALDGEGEIWIDASSQRPLDGALSEHPSVICFSVRDDGCGMSPSQMARACEPFFTTKPAGRGSGIGLASVKEFARENGGAIRLDSAPGRGTTVHIYLPTAQLS